MTGAAFPAGEVEEGGCRELHPTKNTLQEDTSAKILSQHLCVHVSTEGAAGQVQDDHIHADPHKVEIQISAAYFFVLNIK